jgi:hypothetical protein
MPLGGSDSRVAAPSSRRGDHGRRRPLVKINSVMIANASGQFRPPHRYAVVEF